MSDTGMNEQVTSQHSIIGNKAITAENFQRTTHPGAQWFPQAGLGLFIHWSINSVWGMGDLSWPMMKSAPGALPRCHERCGLGSHWVTITPRRYWDLAKSFNPANFDPDKMLSAAKEAGCRYAVFTTRHHDGFAMWPSKYGNFNTSLHMKGRDLVAEYVAACRRNNLKVGLYYSPPDWYFNQEYTSFGGSGLDIDHQPRPQRQAPPEHEAAFTKYMRGQVEELLTNYGQIDLLWFDGHGSNVQSFDELRRMQPGIVINPRGHGYGDFVTPEGVFPKEPISSWWEFCTCFCNGGWGYVDNEIHQASGWMLEQLANTRAWNGSFLPSTGPDGNGEMAPIYYQRMKQLAAWMKHSSTSMFDVTGISEPNIANVPLTARGNTWYAHVTWLVDVPVEIKHTSAPASVKLLRTGEAVQHHFADNCLRFELPSEMRTNLDDVVQIDWKA